MQFVKWSLTFFLLLEILYKLTQTSKNFVVEENKLSLLCLYTDGHLGAGIIIPYVWSSTSDKPNYTPQKCFKVRANCMIKQSTIMTRGTGISQMSLKLIMRYKLKEVTFLLICSF